MPILFLDFLPSFLPSLGFSSQILACSYCLRMQSRRTARWRLKFRWMFLGGCPREVCCRGMSFCSVMFDEWCFLLHDRILLQCFFGEIRSKTGE